MADRHCDTITWAELSKSPRYRQRTEYKGPITLTSPFPVPPLVEGHISACRITLSVLSVYISLPRTWIFAFSVLVGHPGRHR